MDIHPSAVPKLKQSITWKYKLLPENQYTSDIKKADIRKDYEPKKCKCSKAAEDVTPCGSGCTNRCSYSECDLEVCVNGKLCTNMAIQNRQYAPGLERFMTDKKGWGVKATQSVVESSFILEYTGEICTSKEFEKRMLIRHRGYDHYYCLAIDDKIMIDAHRAGSECRFVNHSCAPNCKMVKWNVDGLSRMALFALRDILPGEEICYDYNFSLQSTDQDQECKCGAKECRGMIGSRGKDYLITLDNEEAQQPKTTKVPKAPAGASGVHSGEDCSFNFSPSEGGVPVRLSNLTPISPTNEDVYSAEQLQRNSQPPNSVLSPTRPGSGYPFIFTGHGPPLFSMQESEKYKELMLKKQKRGSRKEKNVLNVFKAEDIKGHKGEEDLDSVLQSMGEKVEEKKLKVKKPKEKKEKLKRRTKETSRKSVKEIEMEEEEYKSEDNEKLEETEIKVGDDLMAFIEICNQINVEHSTQHKDKTPIRIQMKEEVQLRLEEHEKKEEDERRKEKTKHLAVQDLMKVVEEQTIIAAQELIEKRSLVAEDEDKLMIDEAKKSARKELYMNNLKSKAEEAKDEVARAVNKANYAHDNAATYEIEVARDEREAARTAELAEAAAERSKLSLEHYAELLDYEEAMKHEVQNAKEACATLEKDIEEIERVDKGETGNIERAVEVNPLLDFIQEAINNKSQDLECPVCLEEALPPIYSCPAREHILCSSCRPAVSWCPECRESLGTEWIRHRFAERTAEELQGLREKLQSM